MVSGRMLRIRSRRGKNARGVLEFGGKDVIVRAYFEDDVSKQAYISALFRFREVYACFETSYP